MRGRARGVAVLFFLALPGGATAQDRPAVELKPRGYTQLQFNTTNAEGAGAESDEVVGSTFEFRRIRLGVDVAIRDWITGIVETDLTNGRLRPTDVFVNLQFDPAIGLQVGQFKKPFSAIELTSSSKVIPIERNTRIRGLPEAIESVSGQAPVALGDEHGILDTFGYLGRDIGAALNGSVGNFAYSVGLFNGAGANRPDDNDGKSFAGRLAFKAGATPLRLGAAFSRREVGVGTAERDGMAFEADVEWGDFRRPGLHLLAEATTGESLLVGDATFRGAQLWASWFQPLGGTRVEGVEPLVRASWGDPSDEVTNDEGLLVTPGANLYFFGRNRLMLNWDAYFPGQPGLDAVHALRAQLQLFL